MGGGTGQRKRVKGSRDNARGERGRGMLRSARTHNKWREVVRAKCGADCRQRATKGVPCARAQSPLAHTAAGMHARPRTARRPVAPLGTAM
eukprot:5396449-Pleurochrysis_carterae.AAC.1